MPKVSFFLYYWPSLLQSWQKLDQKAASLAESEEIPSESLQRRVTRKEWWRYSGEEVGSFISFPVQKQLKIAQVSASLITLIQGTSLALTVPYYSPRHWSSSQKSGAFIRKFLLVACKFQKMCSKSHFPEQNRKINSRDSTSQKPQDSKNLQKFCHARDFWEQDIFWLFNTTILPLSYNQKGWMPLNTGKFNCCWNLGN